MQNMSIKNWLWRKWSKITSPHTHSSHLDRILYGSYSDGSGVSLRQLALLLTFLKCGDEIVTAAGVWGGWVLYFHPGVRHTSWPGSQLNHPPFLPAYWVMALPTTWNKGSYHIQKQYSKEPQMSILSHRVAVVTLAVLS